MENTEKALDVINDLNKINNDRAAGFEKAGKVYVMEMLTT
jgi:hypothetical protein